MTTGSMPQRQRPSRPKAPLPAAGATPSHRARNARSKTVVTAHESVYRGLRNRILFGGFLPGSAVTLRGLAEDMGVKVEFVPTAWDGIIPALIAGKFDAIIGGMTITPARNLTVNFTAPYANSGVHIAASKKLAAGFASVAT